MSILATFSVYVFDSNKSFSNYSFAKYYESFSDDPSVPKKTSLIKELRIYEHTLPLINPYDRKGENQELGVQLINWAEKVATMEHNSSQIAALTSEVNSSFFKKLGYILENGPHLFKSLELDYISATDCAGKIFLFSGQEIMNIQKFNLKKNLFGMIMISV